MVHAPPGQPISATARRPSPLASLLYVLCGLLCGPAGAAKSYEAYELAAELTALGARIPGSASHRAARLLLLERLQRLSLRDVGELPLSGELPWQSIGGLLPGQGGSQIVLTAHYDTVEASGGAVDNASGCGTVLGAVATLSRRPRRLPVRVLLFDGEETLAAGSRAWLSQLSETDSRQLLAAVAVEMVGIRGTGPGVVHLLASRSPAAARITPAWLVHAVLRGAAAAEHPITVLDRRWSWFAQLAVRIAQPRYLSDGSRFLEAGVPAVLVSDASFTSVDATARYHRASDRLELLDPERLADWTAVLAATVRRLDRLAGRPAAETEYLVMGGRVWIRRDLIWAGFLLWVLLVWTGRPGRWRGVDASLRRRLGRVYLPGFSFRMLFLLSVFLRPTFATLLLYPAALIGLLVAGSGPSVRRLGCGLGTTPLLAFMVWVAAGQVRGWLDLDRAVLGPATLVAVTLASFCAWLLDRPPPMSDRSAS